MPVSVFWKVLMLRDSFDKVICVKEVNCTTQRRVTCRVYTGLPFQVPVSRPPPPPIPLFLMGAAALTSFPQQIIRAVSQPVFCLSLRAH